MAAINENYLKLKTGYLFPEISRRVSAFQKENPGAGIIRLGIGDVTRPLVPSVVSAFQAAVQEMGQEGGFRGYGPEQGYGFLREAIAKNDFESRGLRIDPDEIFVSDGSKCDSGNITEIFGEGNSIAVTDPVYPVYVDTNVMAGRTGRALEDGRYEGLQYLPMTPGNGFSPPLPQTRADLIYLCSPNNPTGAVLSKETLGRFVAYARKNRSVILFDAAYEAYVSDPKLPRSIYEVDGARDVAIEFRSFSKTAGFTGVRCAYIVIPKELRGLDRAGREVALHGLWHRRHTTKFNGVAYPVQAAAAAVYSDQGRQEVRTVIAGYMENARVIREGLKSLGHEVHGGENAPYIWMKTPGGLSSWEFFDVLLKKARVVGTPGSGFGPAGEGYFRLTAFGKPEHTREALERFAALG